MKLFKHLFLAGLLVASGSAHAISLLTSYVNYNGHDYAKISADSWTNSEAFAASLGGHLVAVNDAAENSFLMSTFGGAQESFWLGLYRTAPNAPTFAWSNGEAITYLNWAPSEPNNCCNGEDYTHTYYDGTWNDLDNANTSWYGEKFGIVEIVKTSVPEPSVFIMALTGLGFLGIMRRRVAKK